MSTRRHTNPVLKAMKAERTTPRAPRADELACTVPGCTGIVGPRFVLDLPTGKAGLCPKRELHQQLLADEAKAAPEVFEVRETIAGLLHFGRLDVAAKNAAK